MQNSYPEYHKNPSSLEVIPGEYILKFLGLQKKGFWIFSSYKWFFQITYGPGVGQIVTGTTGVRYLERSKLVRWTFAASGAQYTTPPIFRHGVSVRACLEEDLFGNLKIVAINPAV